jgi:hypothetical protein
MEECLQYPAVEAAIRAVMQGASWPEVEAQILDAQREGRWPRWFKVSHPSPWDVVVEFTTHEDRRLLVRPDLLVGQGWRDTWADDLDEADAPIDEDDEPDYDWVDEDDAVFQSPAAALRWLHE